MAKIVPNQWVIITLPNSAERLVYLKPLVCIELGRYGSFQTDELFGQLSGGYYEVLPTAKLLPIAPSDIDALTIAIPSDAARLATNEEIDDTNTSQRLSTRDVEQLKSAQAEGLATPRDLVVSLVASSETFGRKNVYSQVKYVQRKQKKFLRWICVRLSSMRRLADHFGHRDPLKILDMRVDTVSQLLCQANVGPHGRYLVWDETQGFVVGAMLERIGPAADEQDIRLVALHAGAQLQLPMLPYYNLPESVKAGLLPLALADLQGDEPPPAAFSPASSDPAVHRQRFECRQARRVAGHRFANDRRISALVVVAKDTQLAPELARYLGPSGRLVVYSSFRELLARLYLECRESGEFVDVSLTESWLRPYQVELGRTHPQMTMHSHGGFLLSATCVRVDARPAIASLKARPGL